MTKEFKCRKCYCCKTCVKIGKAEARKGFVEWMKKNRHIINGIDVLEVDRKIKELEEAK
ncbi:hypothetical protein M0R04_14675 [Candidatus Dojkabacteria bacterium]|jgi:hypothetical protein|nr:hypothetical protein [Candidatus Dojkabacteria bacterium]